MSHINDLIGVLRGLRLVVEAGFKTQQEVSNLLWNNSSLKPLISNCPTNPLAYTTNVISPKDFMDRALVVAHGFRRFAIMHVPNMSPDITRPEMDQQMKDEIEELNREFNRTFDTLKKVQMMEPPPPVPPKIVIVAPIEDLQKEVKTAKAKRIEDIVHAVYSTDPVGGFSGRQDVSPVGPKPVVSPMASKPVAKKKIRVAVSIIII